MKKFLCMASLLGVFGFSCVATADLQFEYVDITDTYSTDDPNGRVEGDLSGSGPFTLYDGQGGDLWNDGDTFAMIREENRVTGDFTATVRVVSQTEQVEGRWGKLGIMARADLTGNGANVMPAIYTGSNSQVDDPENGVEHSPVDVRVNGRLASGDNAGGFERPMLRDGAAFQNNFVPVDEDANPAWLRVTYKADQNAFFGAYADDDNGAPGPWAYSAAILDVVAPEGGEGWYIGPAYSTHNSFVQDDLEDAELHHGVVFDNYALESTFSPPTLDVGGSEVGSLSVGGTITNKTVGPDEVAPGLTNYFYDRNMRPGTNALDSEDGFVAASGRGEGGTFDEGEFGAVANPIGLWAGSSGPLTIGDTEIPKYPAGTFSDDDRNDYSAIAKGQIWVPGNGEYTFVDGIDDFTMLAVDLDGDGELTGPGTLINDDLGFAPIDDVVILDDDWVGTNGGGGNGAGNNVAVVEFEGVADGGEWRELELWMAEGGGGDAGILYFGATDDFDPDPAALPITPEEQAEFLLTADQLQTVTNPLTGGDSAASLSSLVNYVIQATAEGSDTIAVNDAGGVLNTTLDVAGATVTVEDSGLASGTEVQLFDADMVTGTDALNLNLADPSQWDLSRLAEGIIVFGESTSVCNPNTLGDIDGSGDVAFADFLILSQNFGQAAADHTTGDIDCSGDVAFADFLVLSQNFGQVVGGAQSVPEPTGFILLGLAGLLGGTLRRRRS